MSDSGTIGAAVEEKVPWPSEREGREREMKKQLVYLVSWLSTRQASWSQLRPVWLAKQDPS
jgi:hypothetical protein